MLRYFDLWNLYRAEKQLKFGRLRAYGSLPARRNRIYKIFLVLVFKFESTLNSLNCLSDKVNKKKKSTFGGVSTLTTHLL